MAKNTLIKRLGALAVGASALVNSSNAADQLEIKNIAQTGIGGSITYLEHVEGGEEGAGCPVSGFGCDSLWVNEPPNPNDKSIKFGTTPYGSSLKLDSRPLNSETVFKGNLYTFINSASGTVTSSDRLKLTFLEGPDATRNYLAKAFLDGTYLSSGQSFNLVTNVDEVISNGQFINLPGIVNVPHNTTYGTLDVSCKFKTENTTTGKNLSRALNLATNQLDGLEYVITQAPTNGTLQGSGANLTYLPGTNFVGNDGFVYHVQWQGNSLADYTVNVNVTNRVDPPMAAPFSASLPRGMLPYTFSFPVSGEGVSVQLVSQPSFGSIDVVNGTNGTFNCSPLLGTASFQYAATNTAGATTNTAQISITNIPPAWVRTAGFTNLEGQVSQYPLAGAATDGDGDALTYSIVTAPELGTMGITNNTLYANASTYGGSYFTLRAEDTYGGSADRTFRFEVQPYERAPQLLGISHHGENMVIPYAAFSYNTPQDVTLLQSDSLTNTFTPAVGVPSQRLAPNAAMPWSTNSFVVPYNAVAGGNYYRLQQTPVSP